MRFFVGLFLLFTFVAHTVLAIDYEHGYSGNRSYDLGATPGFEFLTIPGDEPIATIDIDLGAGVDPSMLGCGAVDFGEYIKAAFDMDIDWERMGQAMQTKLAKYILTELFSHPALASANDALTELRNLEMTMYNESCNIADVMEGGLDKCIQRTMAREGISQDKARKHCTSYSPLSAESMEQIEKFQNALDTIFNAPGDLLRTASSFCGNGEGSSRAGCALTMFLPRMEVCAGGSSGYKCSEMDNEPVISMPKVMGTSYQIVDRLLYVPSKVAEAASRELTSEQRDLVAAQARQFVNAGGATSGTSGAATGAATTSISGESLQYFEFDYQPVTFASSGTNPDPANVDDFKEFIQCTNTNPLTHAEAYVDAAQTMYGVNIPLADYTTWLDDEKRDLKELANITPAVAGQNERYNQLTGYDLPSAGQLIETAINCVQNHHMHVPMDMHNELTKLPKNVKDSFYAAAATRASYLVSELMMRYVKHKLLQAHVELTAQASPVVYTDSSRRPDQECKANQILSPMVLHQMSRDANKSIKQLEADGDIVACKEAYQYPDAVFDSILSMARMMENQIQAMQAIKAERDSYAKIAAVVQDRLEKLRNPQ